jgi:rhodanese-related sulfurtransferase
MASDLREALGRDRPPTVLDVRNAGERAEGAIDGSLHIPLAELPRRLSEVPAGTPVVVYCAAGSRSSIAASLLRRSGYRDVSDLIGGEAAWRLSLTPARRSPRHGSGGLLMKPRPVRSEDLRPERAVTSPLSLGHRRLPARRRCPRGGKVT